MKKKIKLLHIKQFVINLLVYNGTLYVNIVSVCTVNNFFSHVRVKKKKQIKIDPVLE